MKPLKPHTTRYTHFITDTNALLDCPDIIPSIVAEKGKNVVVPLMVAREINNIKDGKTKSDKKEEGTQNYRYINKTYKKQIILNDTATNADIDQLPAELLTKGIKGLAPDDFILAIAIRYKMQGHKTCIVTSDSGLRSLCESLEQEKRPGLLYPNQVI